MLKAPREREEFKVHQAPLDPAVGVWFIPGGGAAPVPLFQGQHWFTQGEQEAHISLTEEVESIISACHPTHSTPSVTQVEYETMPMCGELNINIL